VENFFAKTTAKSFLARPFLVSYAGSVASRTLTKATLLGMPDIFQIIKKPLYQSSFFGNDLSRSLRFKTEIQKCTIVR
jgi:hypothetical protein